MDREHEPLLRSSTSPEALASVKVFALIPAIKKDVLRTIDSSLSWLQLTAADINFSIVRPLVNKYAQLNNMASVYACLVVRSYFLREVATDMAHAGVNDSRAMLCEIIAMKLLSRFASDSIILVAVLTTRWNPLAGANSHIIDQVKQSLGPQDEHHAQSALDVAISTQAKHFLSSPVCQKVVNDIYLGRVVFTTTASRSILADNYKPKAIEIYDSRKAPFIDHYRLRVPFYRAILEFINFAILLMTFVLCLSTTNNTEIIGWELLFVIFAAGFILEEYTSVTEHGWIIYSADLWNTFDLSLIVIFLSYFVIRMKGLSQGDIAMSKMAFDILSCGACLLFPRLAFFAISNKVVVLALRAMIAEFVFFITIAAVCFSGFLFALWTLAQDSHPPRALKSIVWLLTQIWFGSSSVGLNEASSFHPVLGPILMITFSAISNTLLLTILVSLLSNTVSRINENATQEYLVQSAIATMESVQSDALFSYQPPFNLFAFVILKPASFILSPRALHSLNVFLIKTTSLPILFVIGVYERHLAAGSRLRESGADTYSLLQTLPRHIKNMPLIEAWLGSSSNDVYDAIFDVEIQSDAELFDDSDDEGAAPALRSLRSRDNLRTPLSKRPRRPSPSLATASQQPSPQGSPRSRSENLAAPLPLTVELADPEPAPASSSLSPLALLFGPRRPPVPDLQSQTAASRAEATLKQVEALLEDVRELPVQRLKEEMKELQDRQARIESLLLVLTRGLRNESSHRQGSTS